MTEKDWKGNAAADELAKRGAVSRRLPRQWAADVEHLAEGLRRIYAWIATLPALVTDKGAWHDGLAERLPERNASPEKQWCRGKPKTSDIVENQKCSGTDGGAPDAARRQRT